MKTIIKNKEALETLKRIDGFGKWDIEVMALPVITILDDGYEDAFTIRIGFHRNAGSHVTEVIYQPRTPFKETFYCATFKEFEEKLSKMLNW